MLRDIYHLRTLHGCVCMCISNSSEDKEERTIIIVDFVIVTKTKRTFEQYQPTYFGTSTSKCQHLKIIVF